MTPSKRDLRALASNRPVCDERVPTALTRRIRAGGIILLCGRASAEGGRSAKELAVQGIYTCAANMADDGLELRHLLPPESELLLLVSTQRERDPRTREDGEGSFTTFSYVDDRLRASGVVIIVQYGSGTMLDEDDEQPSIGHVTETMSTYRPVAVAVSEIRGLGRSGTGITPFILQCRRLRSIHGDPIWLYDSRHGLRQMSTHVAKALHDEAYEAELEAEKTLSRTSNTMALRTPGGTFVEPCPIGAVAALAPPMARCHILDEEGRDRAVAFLDTPESRPPANQVLYGMPEVYESTPSTGTPPGTPTSPPRKGKDRRPKSAKRRGRSGDPRKRASRRRVDQLALIRWFYAHWLKDEWDNVATAAYLAAHGYSNEGYRRRHGRGASRTLRTDARFRSRDASQICASIWRHRHFHATGQLTVKVRGGRSVVYTVLTRDGTPIVPLLDIARVERAKQAQASLRPRTTVCLLTGLPVDHNGQHLVLVPEHRHGEFRWLYEQRDHNAEGGAHSTGRGRGSAARTRTRPRRRRPPGVPLPHRVFVAAIFTAARTASVLPVIRGADNDERERLSAAVDAARAHAQRATAAYDLGEANFKKILFKSLGHKTAEKALEEANRTRMDAAEALRIAEAELWAFDHPKNPQALLLDDFLDFAAALRDPRDHRLRRQLRNSIVDFQAASTRSTTVGDLRHGVLEFSFRLRLLDRAGRLWELPVTGRHDAGSALRILPKVYAAIQTMHDGVPLEVTFGKSVGAWKPWVRAALTGDPNSPCVVVNIRDPYLLMLGMRILYPPIPEPDWTSMPLATTPAEVPRMVASALTTEERLGLAGELGEPASLLDHLAERYGHPPGRTGRWLPCSRPQLGAAVRAAAAGTLTSSDVSWALLNATQNGHRIFEPHDGRIRLRPCRWCGSRRRLLMQMHEPEGLVCASPRCRRDEAGAVWPAVPYDLYEQRPRVAGSRARRVAAVGAASAA